MTVALTPPPPAQALQPSGALLIGLVGHAGAGKSTVARMLEDDYAFVHLAYADPLLDMLGALFGTAGIDGAWAVERSLKELPTPLGYSYRHLVQTLGTEWGRGLHPDFWVRVLALRAQQPALAHENLVVSDVRFPNEAAWIAERGGVLVRVRRHDLPPVRGHESETHIDRIQCHTELLNFGSLATLHDQVDRLITLLRKIA